MQASAAKQASGGIQASAFFALFLSLFFLLSVYVTLLFFFTQASPDSARHAFLAMICNDFNIKVVSATSKYTAISKKVVAKSARDNPERDCGDCELYIHLLRSLKEWHERPWKYVCEC